MQVKIDGACVMFRAIESFSFDEDRRELVLRTVSGHEHRKGVRDKMEADRIVDQIIERMAFFESLGEMEA